jgi:hypothetical protein
MNPYSRMTVFGVTWFVVTILVGIFAIRNEPTHLYSAAQLARFQGNTVVLHPAQWVGSPLPILDFVDIRDALVEGDWTVILYYNGCPHCKTLLDAIMLGPRPSGLPSGTAKIAIIEMPPYSDTLEVYSPSILHGRLAADRKWVARAPVIIHVQNGIVMSARDGIQQ